jgi:hypothetical protein
VVDQCDVVLSTTDSRSGHRPCGNRRAWRKPELARVAFRSDHRGESIDWTAPTTPWPAMTARHIGFAYLHSVPRSDAHYHLLPGIPQLNGSTVKIKQAECLEIHIFIAARSEMLGVARQ